MLISIKLLHPSRTLRWSKGPPFLPSLIFGLPKMIPSQQTISVTRFDNFFFFFVS